MRKRLADQVEVILTHRAGRRSLFLAYLSLELADVIAPSSLSPATAR
jgi:hypothetical protein